MLTTRFNALCAILVGVSIVCGSGVAFAHSPDSHSAIDYNGGYSNGGYTANAWAQLTSPADQSVFNSSDPITVSTSSSSNYVLIQGPALQTYTVSWSFDVSGDGVSLAGGSASNQSITIDGVTGYWKQPGGYSGTLPIPDNGYNYASSSSSVSISGQNQYPLAFHEHEFYAWY